MAGSETAKKRKLKTKPFKTLFKTPLNHKNPFKLFKTLFTKPSLKPSKRIVPRLRDRQGSSDFEIPTDVLTLLA